jgi:hypothetical protein
MNLKGIRCGVVDWIKITQNWIQWQALVNTVINLQVPIKGGTLLDKVSDYQLFRKYPASWSQFFVLSA